MNIEREILRFLQSNNIPYDVSGPDVAKGNVTVKCPYCNTDWKSMGIKLSTGWYGCWRAKTHRGKDISRPLSAITGLDRNVIRSLLKGDGEIQQDPTAFAAIANGSLFAKEVSVVTSNEAISIPKSFRKVRCEGTLRRFFDYLRFRRGFGNDTVECINRYNLYACRTGVFKSRIIMPVTLNKDLVGWTSRTIRNDVDLRYMHLSTAKSMGNGEMPLAVLNIKRETVYNYDRALLGGRILVVVEGPFDCHKVDLYGWRMGVRAVGAYNTALTTEQLYLLKELVLKFDTVVVMLDPHFEADAMHMASEIGKGAVFESTPVIFKGSDLGDLKKHDVLRLCSSLLSKYSNWSVSHG